MKLRFLDESFKEPFSFSLVKNVLLYLINLEWLSYAQHMAGTASMQSLSSLHSELKGPDDQKKDHNTS